MKLINFDIEITEKALGFLLEASKQEKKDVIRIGVKGGRMSEVINIILNV